MVFQASEEATRFRREVRRRMEHAYESRSRARKLEGDSARVDGLHWTDLRDAVSATHASYELVGQLPPQPPTPRGRIKATVARVMQRLMFWYTPHLVRFHFESVRVFEEQIRAVQSLGSTIDALMARNDGLETRCDALETRLEAAASRERSADDQLRAKRTDWDTMYVALENKFRGERADIKERLRVYLPRIAAAGARSHEMLVLDVGCGRGEWLELLREEGVESHGIDSNGAMVATCRQFGLSAHEADALEFLRTQPESSWGAITAFHVIEHLPTSVLIEFLDEVLRALKPGGIAILETPNPNNLLTASRTFYLDPTHRHPIPTALGRFFAEARGFRNVEIVELHPWEESHRISVEKWGEMGDRWNGVFHGPQDYAIIALK